ncbi:MAG: hypothetical protein JWO92_502 [Chitinophagaceae bacterium]|nr:hypothetical protein [Chitinophagaceae bacterium]
MKKVFIVSIFSFLYLYTLAQTNPESTCATLKAKGYTKAFCEYNNKYAYKNIPFESSIDFVSSKFKLTKKTDYANKYDCKDVDVLSWATVTFDNCFFEFSSNGKLVGIQLQLFNKSSTTIAEIKSKIKQIKNYLTFYFGKPEKSIGDGLDTWRGDKVYILIAPPNEKLESGAVVAIYRTNTNVIDDL